MGTGDETTRMDHVDSNLDDYKNSGNHVEEIAIARLTDEAIFELSAESLNLRSKTGLRIFGVMFVQGCIMAGYGIDWSVIGGINNFDVRTMGEAVFLVISLMCIRHGMRLSTSRAQDQLSQHSMLLWRSVPFALRLFWVSLMLSGDVVSISSAMHLVRESLAFNNVHMGFVLTCE